MTFAKVHPLLEPSIALHISRLVALGDAFSCAQVCRAWNDPFTSAIWHTIDLSALWVRWTEFNMPIKKNIMRKNGHRIRVVKGLFDVDQLMVLHDPSVCRLQKLSILLPTDYDFQAYCGDILSQNAASIIELGISAQSRMRFPFSFDAIIPTHATSKLSSLSIENIFLTRDGLSYLLRMCPVLETLKMQRTTIRSASCSEPYRHTGLKKLICPLEQIFQPDPKEKDAPSMLVHFPGLRSLQCLESESSAVLSQQTMKEMKDQFRRYCPLLQSVAL